MQQIGRQTSNDFNDYDNFKRQKLQKTTDQIDGLRKKSISHFESLSNELIYEIFEYLDYFDVYKTFSNLNQRFYSLLNNSNVPIKINIPLMSPSTFDCYNEDIIKPNIHRIRSLRFGDVFMNDFILLSIPNLTKFQRLQTLIIYGIESIYLENLLDELHCLSLLTSLVITSIDTVSKKSTIYHRIFRLPTLKYCKLALLGRDSEEPLPMCTNKYSSIEHLIIDGAISSDELDRLFSYVPQLRRLSVVSLLGKTDRITTIPSNLFKNLTHVSFKRILLKFDEFIQLFKDIFQNVEGLHFTVEGYDIDQEYMNANKWKDMILTYIPKLRIFNFLFDHYVVFSHDLLHIEIGINQFTSSFWIERQWFFTHHVYRKPHKNRLRFYSTNPYRKKHYILHEQIEKNNSSNEHRSKLNSVQCLRVQSNQNIIDCQYYFPNVNEIIFENAFSMFDTSFVTNLYSIIPLNQLTKLVIECFDFSIQTMVKILYHTPNTHTLMLESMSFFGHENVDLISIQQSEEFQFVSNRNKIEHVTGANVYVLEHIKFLVALCPRVKSLAITSWISNIESIIRWLLDKTNPNTRHLYALQLLNQWADSSVRLNQLIESESLLDDYTLKPINRYLYLGW